MTDTEYYTGTGWHAACYAVVQARRANRMRTGTRVTVVSTGAVAVTTTDESDGRIGIIMGPAVRFSWDVAELKLR